MEKIVISIGGLIIMEPIVSLTDIMVSVACFIAFFKLNRLKFEGRMYFHFKALFLTMGFATFFGGIIGHAFIYAFNTSWKLAGWLISMISINFLERAFIAHTIQFVSERKRFFIKTANNVELLIFMGIAIYTLDFTFVEIHTGFGILAVVFPTQLYMYIKTNEKGAKYVFIVVALSIVSALVFIKQLSIHKWFNHIALSHVIMTVMVILLYKSATILEYDKNLESKERKIYRIIPRLMKVFGKKI